MSTPDLEILTMDMHRVVLGSSSVGTTSSEALAHDMMRWRHDRIAADMNALAGFFTGQIADMVETVKTEAAFDDWMDRVEAK